MSLLGACTERSNEQVWTCLQWWPPGVNSRGLGLEWRVPCLMSGRGPGLGVTMSRVWQGELEPGGGSMYSEVQCIMGNGHMGHPCGQTEWQTHMTENIAFPQLHWWLLSRCSGKKKSPLLSLAWYLFSVEKGSRYLPSSSNVFLAGWLYLW